MKKRNTLAIVLGSLLGLGCQSTISDASHADNGAIYVATNKPLTNTVVAYKQASNGKLEKLGEFATGGKGTGNVEIFEGSKNDPTEPLADGVDPLISAYGVFKTQHGKQVLVVNAGDSSVSSFNVNADYSLALASKVKAGDKYPLSIASHGELVYVASAGNQQKPPFSGNISGYRITAEGKLSGIPNSTRDLGARPTAVAFTDNGEFLVVVELVTGKVKVFAVDANGNISKQPVSVAQSPHDADKGRWLPIPVGFDIVKNGNGYTVLVSEARFLNNKGQLEPDPTGEKVPQSPKYQWQVSSTSSYSLSKQGEIKLVSADVLTGTSYYNGEIANCWVEVSADGKVLWAANALSSSISSYRIGLDSSLTLINETAYKDESEKLFFSDLYLSKNGKFLNQLIGNEGTVLVFKVLENGDLKLIDSADGLPAVGAYGMVSL